MQRRSGRLMSLACVCRLVSVFACLGLMPLSPLSATDFFLTIGGGYKPAGNQASLEANVLFFQEVLLAKHTGGLEQAIFFADGNDPQPDLQVLEPKPKHDETVADSRPLSELLQQLYGSPDDEDEVVEYRNHRIDKVSGPNLPQSIHASLQRMCSEMHDGDRLIIYVTAHGGEAVGLNHNNTTISCWNDQSIAASEFARWLDDVPRSVPAIMVMAQCYCGGFAHTIFDNAQRRDGLADRVRVGFFAQQHDLPAAGCRPDIENDEEYSSFFWGAFMGRSRTGRAMLSADFNRDGSISFAEAHAHAMLASETIDIPLRSTEALLRAYSRIAGYDHRRDRDAAADSSDSSNKESNTESNSNDDADDDHADAIVEAEQRFDDSGLVSMTGTLDELIEGAAPELQQTVEGLAKQLDIELTDDVPIVFVRFQEQRDASRELRRTSWRGRRRGGSGGRQLRAEIREKWPQLSAESWNSAPILKDADQHELLEQIAKLPNYQRFTNSIRSRKQSQQARVQAELREVKFQRLVNTLEAIVLARNLERLADAEVVERYRAMLKLEQSSLSASP